MMKSTKYYSHVSERKTSTPKPPEAKYGVSILIRVVQDDLEKVRTRLTSNRCKPKTDLFILKCSHPEGMGNLWG